MKTCSVCKLKKPLTEFWRRTSAPDGYRNECKDCERKYRRSEKGRAAQKRYETGEKGKAHRQKINKRFREKHDDDYFAKYWDQYKQDGRYKKWSAEARKRPGAKEIQHRHNQTEKRRKTRREWARSEKGRKQNIASQSKRRTQKTQAGGSFTYEEFETLCNRYGHCCLACGKQVPLTPDHIIPIAKGGSSDISNIQPLCLPCNIKKHTTIIDYRP